MSKHLLKVKEPVMQIRGREWWWWVVSSENTARECLLRSRGAKEGVTGAQREREWWATSWGNELGVVVWIGLLVVVKSLDFILILMRSPQSVLFTVASPGP